MIMPIRICVGPPEFLSPQNETIEVNIDEEVILNCSASSSPHSVYTWIIPSGCSSCQKHSNNSSVTFIANISSSRDYICVAGNDYGSITKQIGVNVICKFLLYNTRFSIYENFECLGCEVKVYTRT